MTILDPTVPECPECGSPYMDAEVRVHHTIKSDGYDGIEYVDASPDSFGAFEQMVCQDCDHSLIVDGEIVDDTVTGTEV